MGCKPASSATKDSLIVNQHDLDETGRLQYFYHSPASDLPVRDVLNQLGRGYKTEPHLEKRAENYCSGCLQQNIKRFLQNNEKYLFLVTRCMKRESRHFGEHYVVGYIRKRRHEYRPGGFYAVIGDTKIYAFHDAYLLRQMVNFRHHGRKVDRRTTSSMLDHFEGATNILDKCVAELELLKKRLPDEERKSQLKQCR
jgi:hypothetical protein